MTDTPDKPSPLPPDPHDSVVEQAVERAAVKVAAAVATAPTVNGTTVLSKIESLAVVAVLVIVGLMNFVINLQTKNNMDGHKQDFKELCQAFVDLTPPDKARELAERFAECLK